MTCPARTTARRRTAPAAAISRAAIQVLRDSAAGAFLDSLAAKSGWRTWSALHNGLRSSWSRRCDLAPLREAGNAHERRHLRPRWWAPTTCGRVGPGGAGAAGRVFGVQSPAGGVVVHPPTRSVVAGLPHRVRAQVAR